MLRVNRIVLIALAVIVSFSSVAAQGYKKPSPQILEVLNAPVTPSTSVSPSRDRIALLTPLRYPPIADLAAPMLRLGGLRINPETNAPHTQQYFVAVALQNISDGTTKTVQLPSGAKIVSPSWSADGKYIAVGNVTANGVELWIVDTATAVATHIKGVQVNSILGGFSWMPDQRSLVVNLVPENRGPAPKYINVVPNEPSVQETRGRQGFVQTFQDLLKSPNDERLFEYFTTSQIAVVSLDGKVTRIGEPAIFDNNDPSPDGTHFLVTKIEKPFSYLFPYSRFPKTIEVWNNDATQRRGIAKLPLTDYLTSGAVPVGPRSVAWVPTEKSTIMWVEALDGGDSRKKIFPSDEIMILEDPMAGTPRGLLKVEHRLQGRLFAERGNIMFFYDYDREKQRRRMFWTNYKNPTEIKLMSDLNINDRYNDIGQPVTKRLANGYNAVIMDGEAIYLSGNGASPEGDRPFLRRMTISDLQTVEMFRSSVDEYETFVSLISDKGFSFITRKESLESPPNLFRRAGRAAPIPLTNFTDPTPQIRGIKKQLVRYKRDDGVDLSFTLYLPADHKPGDKLPTVLWAYPQEFTDASTASQVTGSTNRFTTIGGYSHLFFVMHGYAVLDNATMPIVGDPQTVNDNFVQQVVASAKAAIDKGVEMGVVDPERVAVGGHSYGAFMTANLLAHSDLFRAGLARSGAYNRTLTPFGFQSERRSFWEAPEMYAAVSPFFHANKIKDPILLIHGDADNNTGTFPIQSERLYSAIQGNGGTARLVMLPLESHGYIGRESIEHTLYEMVEWLERFVKNAEPRNK
jgi:dipeptidyl aminopeptidase/acylaminoacyl peptidase